MQTYILDLSEIGKTQLPLVGGKGANLGELAAIEGLHVPDGFCITTEAFGQMMAETPVDALLDRLSELKVEDRSEIAALSAEIREAIEATPIPANLRTAISVHLSRYGQDTAWAVRSSATAEDLPTASFAGQQDTFLNVIGEEAVLHHIARCRASLFTERAVVYRTQNGFDHRKVQLSVVVQQMVFPQAAGILFTADPVTSDRTVVSIDAGFGLGEALVSGLVNADTYTVRAGRVTGKKISVKKLAITAVRGGGTQQTALSPERQQQQVLTDEQILQLAQIGRKIEAHFGNPQDIEWCLADGVFFIVQSRPITTLYPIPEASDGENHVYLSVGHQQMMTDAMKPLGLSFYLLMTPAPMRAAGGRLFVDATPILASPARRKVFFDMAGPSDPLTIDALTTILERGDFVSTVEDAEPDPASKPGSFSIGTAPHLENDPAIPARLIAKNRASVEELKQTIAAKSGPELFAFIREDIVRLRGLMFEPDSISAIKTGMDAAIWINEQLYDWLGEKNAADTLAQSVPNNVTSEMGLALLDVADVIRPFPEVVAYLQEAQEDFVPEDLLSLHGGPESCQAIRAYLDRYGMRCAGEIDITKTRWSERPSMLVPVLLSNVRSFAPGEGKRRFEQGEREALQQERAVLERLRQLPDGEEKAAETQRRITAIRTFAGYREFPKYSMISHYFVYRQALLREGERLVQSGILNQKDDIFYLSFDELEAVVRTGVADEALIVQREAAFKMHEKLRPPRVITSDGEVLSGSYKRSDLPAGAIAGLAVSSGVVEGRARVILDLSEADVEEGDILVTAFTDPSWTPLFVAIKGLVTEVGGLMTHGAVVAREYGLPAVVGMENATRLIKDGQRIRVNGTEGFVEIV